MSKLSKLLLLGGCLLISAASFAYYGTEANIESAKGFLNVGAAVNAETRLLSALKENPFDIEGWMLLGDFYSQYGRLDEALDAYDRAVALSAGDVSQVIKRLKVLIRLNRVSEAETGALEVVALHPENVEALHILGWIALRRASEGAVRLAGTVPNPEFLEEAERRFEEAIRINPLNAEAYIGRGVVAGLQGRPLDSISLLDRSIAIDSGYYWGWHLLGDQLRALGRDSDAESAYRRAQLLAEDRPYSLIELASLARQENQDLTAAGYMALVGARGAYNRGMDFVVSGNYAEAEKGFMEALLVDPEDEAALDQLEEVRIQLYPAADTRRVELAVRRITAGEKAEAVNDSLLSFKNYRRAIRLAPQLSEARLQMAKFFDRQGAYTLAVTQLQRVEELTRSQNERLVASDMMEVITRKALSEMERVHSVRFGDIWDEPTSVLGELIGNPETLEARIRWGVNPIPRPRVRIAILPFEESGKPVHLRIGNLAADWLRSTLLLLPGFELVSIEEINAAVKARIAQSPGEIDPGILGGDLRADIVVRGKILEVSNRVDLSVEAIKVPAGPAVWSQNFSFSGADAMGRATLAIARTMAQVIPLKGTVIRRQGQDRMTINLGRVHGISVGDTVTILRSADELFVAGLDWPGVRESVIGSARVVSLTERYGEIEPVAGAQVNIRAGDVVRRKDSRPPSAVRPGS